MSLDSPIPLHFEGEEADEEVLIVLRAHPLVQIGWILSTIVFLLFPLLGLLALFFFQPSGLPFSLITATLAFLVWSLLILGVAF